MKKILFTFLMCLSFNVMAWTPQKPIKISVGFPPGGNVDNIARILEQGFKKQNIKAIVENKPGAGGVIATAQLYRSAADNHNLLLTPTSFLFSKLLKFSGTDYDVINDFTHVITIGTVENHIYANQVSVNGDMQKVLEDIKSNKKKYRWGTTGPHAEFAVHLISTKLAVDINIIPYNGGPSAINDLLGGHIDIVVDSGTSVLKKHAEDGRVKFLANFNFKKQDRNAIENYIDGVVSHSFFGISMHQDTPKDVIEFYRKTFNLMFSDPEIVKKLKNLGLDLALDIDFKDLIQSQKTLYEPLANKINDK